MISLCLHWPGSLTAENADGFEGWRGPIAALVLSLGLVAWRHVERLGAAAARPLRNAASCAPSMPWTLVLSSSASRTDLRAPWTLVLSSSASRTDLRASRGVTVSISKEDGGKGPVRASSRRGWG